MLVLAIDTATRDLVAGVVEADPSGPTLRAERVLANSRGHNEQLLPAIFDALEEAGASFADLGAVVVGHGPGPFTGLRVGMATGQAIAQARGIPVHGVGTLDAIARRYRRESGAADAVLVATDARRREVYYAVYAPGEVVSSPAVARPADVALPADTARPAGVAAPGVGTVVIADDLHERLAPELRRLPHVDLTPRAVDLVAAADLSASPAPLSPAYLRRPDAVPPAARPRSSALPPLPGDASPGPSPSTAGDARS